MKKIIPVALLSIAMLTYQTFAVDLAIKSNQEFIVDNQEATISSYVIKNNNYVKLRDVASLLDFYVKYDKDTDAIYIDTDEKYAYIDETTESSIPDQQEYTNTRQKIFIDDKEVNILGYAIGGNNYFKLRDIAQNVNFSVIYDGVDNIIAMDSNAKYFEHQGNTVVLMYHDFTNDENAPELQQNLVTTGEKFRQDIRTMRELGYECISLEDYYNGKTEKDKKYFIITMDDGYLSNYEIAYPILKEENAYASIFVVTRSVQEKPTFFNFGMAKEMELSGLVKVYSHNLYHMNSTLLDKEEFNLYLSTSYQENQKFLGEKTEFFAYPYGAYNETTYSDVKNNGYKLQMVQERKFSADDVIVRNNVCYKTDMTELVKTAVHN